MAWKEKKKYDVELSYEDLKRMREIRTLDGVMKEREEIEMRLQKLDLHRKVLLKNEDKVFEYMFNRWVRQGDTWNNWEIIKVSNVFTTFKNKKKYRTERLHHKNVSRLLYRYSKDFKTLVERMANISELIEEK